MSLPKHDPSLAAFLKNLDPSMYSISGGESPTAPVAREVEGLRNDLESRYRETQIREDAAKGKVEMESCYYPSEEIYSNLGQMNRCDRARKELNTITHGVCIGIGITLALVSLLGLLIMRM